MFPELKLILLGDKGEGTSGLSAVNIVRLKKKWEQEYDARRKRNLSGKEYVYFRADGIYFNLRLDDSRSFNTYHNGQQTSMGTKSW
ncbi:MAG: hypothetical protein R6U35_00185 [Candidatus Humimicrobiaceae bacterium]